MQIKTIFTALVATALLVPLASAQTTGSQTRTSQSATQQQTAVQSSQSRVPVTQAAAPLKKLGFRVTEWKTIHSKTQAQAQQDLETLKKIGCEVVSSDHGNHIDIKYRCSQWKSIKLASDDLVKQWSAWCTTKGMETVVVNPPANTKKPTVRFMLPAARTVHLHDPVQAAQIVNTLNLVGCSVTTQQHNGHTDATFSCPQWLTIQLESEDSAHSWQKWLKDSGFETQHTHVH